MASILAEFSPKKLRHRFIPLGSIFSSVGWFFAAMFSLLLIPHFGWRAIYWVGVLPALVAVYLRYGMPESVRFLLAKGRDKEAGVVVHDLARRAGRGISNWYLLHGKRASRAKLWSTVCDYVLFGPHGGTYPLLFFSKFQTFGMNAWLPTVFMRQGYRLTTSFGLR